MAQPSNQGDSPRDGSQGGSTSDSLQKAAARRNLIWLIIILLVVVWIWGTMNGVDDRTSITYSDFVEEVEEGNVSRVTIKGEQEIQGELVEPRETFVRDERVEYTEFVTHAPTMGGERLMERLEGQGIDITAEPESDFSWWLILFYAVPLLFIIFLFIFLMRGMQSQGQQMFSMGKSRAKTYQKGEGRETFDDVAGHGESKYELEEVVDFLGDPSRFERLGGEIPRGVLLVGPPGTGKTLLARAVAGEADVPFFSLSGSDFMEMLVGVGASRVRDLFKDAKENAPSIIFIDELDSIGRRRGAGLGGGHDEREQTLNQLLSEMDGFEPNAGVVVMGATNRPDILDPALLRPGRFDRQVAVPLPTKDDRVEILGIHARRKPLGQDVDLEEIARSTAGFSGADLKNLMNEAALLAGRKEKQEVGMGEIEEARDKVLLGLERKSVVLTEEERQMLAYHEAGHAVVAALLPHTDPIHKVTIVPRGQAMGVTQQVPVRDRFIYSREYLLDRLAVVMGGRAAEDVVFHTSTSGAENDLQQATAMARRMVLSWGMSERFGRLSSGSDRQEVFLGEELAQKREHSDATAREADEEVRRIVDEAYEKAARLLREHREGMDELVQELLDHEEVAGRRVYHLLGLELPAEIARSSGATGGNDANEDGEEEAAGADADEARTGEHGHPDDVEAPDSGTPADPVPPGRDGQRGASSRDGQGSASPAHHEDARRSEGD